MTKHMDYVGKPLCGAPALGALVVDRLRHSTCDMCAHVASALAAGAGLVAFSPDVTAETLADAFVGTRTRYLEEKTAWTPYR